MNKHVAHCNCVAHCLVFTIYHIILFSIGYAGNINTFENHHPYHLNTICILNVCASNRLTMACKRMKQWVQVISEELF